MGLKREPDVTKNNILETGQVIFSSVTRVSDVIGVFSCRESLVKDLESNLQQKKDDIARFEEERTDLIAKVQ